MRVQGGAYRITLGPQPTREVGPGWRQRMCPTCEARPGWPCRTYVSGRVKGQETGGGYWKDRKTPHVERKVST